MATLGHTQVRTTLRYAHVAREFALEAAAAMDRAFSRSVLRVHDEPECSEHIARTERRLRERQFALDVTLHEAEDVLAEVGVDVAPPHGS
jgi:hypothetical protein